MRPGSLRCTIAVRSSPWPPRLRATRRRVASSPQAPPDDPGVPGATALLSTIPPTLIDRIDVSNNTSNTATADVYGTNDNSDESSPTIVVDPKNPNHLVASWQRYDTDLSARNQILVEMAQSTDGGASWKTINSSLLPSRDLDPSTSNPVQPYPNIDSPSVAFAPDGSFYLMELQHNGTTSGELLLTHFNAAGTGAISTTTVYSWDRSKTNQDRQLAIMQPTLAIDDTLPSFIDPDTGVVVTNPHVGNIYISYIGDTPPPQNPPSNPPWNRTTVELLTSTDGGTTFGAPLVLNNGGNDPLNNSSGFSANRGNQTNARPRMAISQGGGGASPGQVTVIWDDFGTRAGASPPASLILARPVTGGGTTLGNETQVASVPVVLANASGGGNVGGLTAIGIGPQPSIAADNTLSSAPNAIATNGTRISTQGRIYVAYATRTNATGNPDYNTDINLTFSTDGGATWQSATRVNDDNAYTDGFSEDASGLAGRPQFMPEVAVDNTTGTVVVQFYDARYDAAHVRAAMMVTASVDGGQSFSPQQNAYVNQPEAVLDLATGASRSTGPIPDNQSSGNPNADGTFGYGLHQGLAVLGGKVYTAWSGNENGGPDGKAFLDIRVARTTIAAGPRITSGTSGVVTTTDGSGVPQASQFTVTFDRPIDTSTFDTSDVTIKGYAADGTPLPAITATNVAAVSSFPYGLRQGATTFRVTFPGQTTPGTYTYTVGPNIRALAFSGASTPGPEMDQDGNAVTGSGGSAAQASFNEFAVPGTTGVAPAGTPGRSVLPLVVPAPRVTSTQVITTDGTASSAPDTPNLVLNGTVAAFRVRFDRVMQASSFTPVDVLRITGPGGDVDPSSFTVTPVDDSTFQPLTGSNVTTRTFVVGFAKQQLSGTYQLLLGPNIQSTGGYLVDSNANAGVDALRNTVQTTYSGGGQLARNGGIGNLDPTITIPDNFSIRDLNLTLSTAGFSAKDLTVDLVGPDGTTVRIFSAAKAQVASNFSQTTFDDQAPLSINDALVASLSTFRPVGRLDAFDGTMSAGTYTLQFRSASAGSGAALGVLSNWQLVASRQAPLQNPTVEVRYDSTDVPQTIPIRQTIESKIVIPENFQISDLNLQLNIAHTNDPDLSAELVGPTGIVVPLFSGVGNSGTTDDFQDTIFDDQADLPISSGGPPFASRYQPQGSLAALNTTMSAGTYTLRITNNPASNQAGVVGTLNSWRLIVQRVLPGTGLGEPAGDRINADFRIFTMDPANGLASSTWTAVGPASANSGGNSGRVTGLAIDPSDPSGNTVYAGGASGGIWKTNNFLTTDSEGPTWIPLVDQVATHGMNIGGIAVFGRNGDPNQSIVFATTGEGDTGSPGVGLLRSMDGGKSWELLDSLDNTVPFAQRGHELNGLSSFKVVVDPRANPAGNAVVYAAFSGNGGGIYRSTDSGAHWQNVLAGQATDVVLDQSSGTVDPFTNPTGNLQIVFAAIRGSGVSISTAQGRAGSWSLMAGGVGVPQILDNDVTPVVPVPVSNPPSTPNGTKGRIVLARPALAGTDRANLIYGGWLYAAVSTVDDHLDGLYLTKDYGANWTKLRIPTLAGTTLRGTPSQRHRQDRLRPAGQRHLRPGQLRHRACRSTRPTRTSSTWAVRPTATRRRMIRVDASDVNDPHAFYLDDNLPDGGLRRNYVAGAVSVEPTANNDPRDNFPSGTDPRLFGTINLLRNPNDLTNADSTVFVDNAGTFSNSGAGVRWIPFGTLVAGTTDVHRIITLVDPVSGKARLIVGDDQGIFTGVDDGTGQLLTSVGNNRLPTGSRNGNIQITQFYKGAAQPSALAAQIAGALLYGQAQDDGFPRSNADILSSGNLNWTGSTGDGTGVATDQTGSGTAYQYNWPCCGGNITGFFRVDLPDGVTGTPSAGPTA